MNAIDKDVYPNLKQGIILIVLFLSCYIVFILATGLLPQLFGYQPSAHYITTIFNFAIFSVIPLIIYFSKKSRIPLDPQFEIPERYVLLLIVFLAVSVTIFTSQLMNFEEHYRNLLDGKLRFLVFKLPVFNLEMMINFVSSVIFAPVIEEYFFRKQLQGQLLKKYPHTLAIVISSLFFMFCHLRTFDFCGLFVRGLFYGFVYYKTKSIEASILLHSIHNLITKFSITTYFDIASKLVIYIGMMLVSVLVMILIVRSLN